MSDTDQNKNETGAPVSPELQSLYLQAMGIQVWQSRYLDESPEPNSIPLNSWSVISESDASEVVSDDHRITPDHLSEFTNLENQSSVQTEEMTGWPELEKTVVACTACELHQTRTHSLLSEGANNARLLFITSAPLPKEPAFLSSEASFLFTNMLKAIEMKRTDIHLTSLVKCQLPEGQELRTTEVICCEQYLSQQIELVQPDLIIALGETCAQHLVVSKKALNELRGKVYQYQSRALMVMSHPDDLLIQPQLKRQAWHDLLQIKQKLQAR